VATLIWRENGRRGGAFRRDSAKVLYSTYTNLISFVTGGGKPVVGRSKVLKQPSKRSISLIESKGLSKRKSKKSRRNKPEALKRSLGRGVVILLSVGFLREERGKGKRRIYHKAQNRERKRLIRLEYRKKPNHHSSISIMRLKGHGER